MPASLLAPTSLRRLCCLSGVLYTLLVALEAPAAEVTGEILNPNEQFGKDVNYKLTGKATFDWQHSGVLTILTTPDGANLPASAVETDFPLLVRLDKDWFDFSQAKANGEGVRFSTSTGVLKN